MAVQSKMVGGLGELAPRYDIILSDIWGVVHNGRAAYPAACEALARFRAAGGTVVLITNAPRPRPPVLRQMAALGVPHSAFDAVVTSGDVTLDLIAAHGAAPVHHIGPERDLALFEALSVAPGRRPPLVPLAAADYVVVTGLFDDLTETPADYDATLATMRARAMPLICANPDIVVHVGDKLLYCGGAIAARFEAQGGESIYAGKPHAPIYERALALAEGQRGGATPRPRILAIGDALATDIAGAQAQDLDVLMITAGIHRDELHAANGALDHAVLVRLADTAQVGLPRWHMPALRWQAATP